MKRSLAILATSLAHGLAITFGLFLLFGAIPGDAVDVLASAGDLDESQQAAMRAELGLDQPAWRRFLAWGAAALAGDLGTSQRFGQPVGPMLWEAAGVTLQLCALSGALGILLAFGLCLAQAAGSRGAQLAVEAINLWSIALPTFCIGVAALLLFSVWLGWLPAIGGLLAPVLILGIDNAGQIAKPLSEEVAEVVARPHVMAARARGLTPLGLARWHVLPLAAPVAVSLTGVMLAGLLGGTLTMELLFGLPGMGALVLNGIQGRDQPVVLAGLVAAALAIVLVNALSAVMQSVLDPRLGGRE
ncbi:ABC transporter permease [Roseococcus sp. SDR]|uniref:ABC transporter permease n=1 Tax=Roseococcus sp. SDR TaxID=2835532 RepID=UPI001BCDC015|nr:ABC transporter permease [Roseococcus sp. SDR]MBS7792271.1 ABC transporter permease [Roseococcus sp. SDR]MBV1847585.1 ABC transporter permease [Roseococcus sp. SDR]